MSDPRVVLAPRVEADGGFAAWCRSLPATIVAAPDGAVIHRARNLLLRLDAPSVGTVVVKHFGRGPRWRTTKAERSYTIALELIRRGVPTPEPLGWLSWTGGSAYVCQAVPAARQLELWLRSGEDGWRHALRAAGIAAARSHRAGVRHRDLSPGNLIAGREPDDPDDWYLVDLNRVRFATVAGPEDGAAMLDRLAAHEAHRGAAFLAGYASAWGCDPARVVASYRSARWRWWRGARLRKRSRGLRRQLVRRLRA